MDVADKPIDMKRITGRRRDWTPIAVDIDGQNPLTPHLLKLAEEYDWQLKHLKKFSGDVPSQFDLRGAILTRLATDQRAAALLDRGIPVVRIGTFPNPEDHRMPAVMTDRPQIGRLVAEHFAQRDFRHVAYEGREPWEYDKHLYDAFATRAAQLGMTCHLRRLNIEKLRGLVTEDKDMWQLRQEDFAGWLVGLPKPIGLLAFADAIADRYCEWAVQAGLRVPEDVAILGIGNDPLICQSAVVPLSSIAHDYGRIALNAVQMLMQLMADQSLPSNTVMIRPVGIVTRQSTDVLAASDPYVVRALRFMWDHITEDLSVNQIAEQAGVSRRTLEKAFRRDLDRGVNTEFQRRRLEKARELLLQTELSITDIARTFNFSSRSYFCRAFQAAYATSPSQYRFDARAGN